MVEISNTPCEQKVWGKTQRVYERNGVSIAHATIVRGGYSSKHYHAKKDNVFQVVTGLLHVQLFVDGPEASPVTYVLAPGMTYRVPAGTWHRFVASSPTELIEVYDSADEDPPSPQDIVRHDEGGVDPNCNPA